MNVNTEVRFGNFAFKQSFTVAAVLFLCFVVVVVLRDATKYLKMTAGSSPSEIVRVKRIPC